MTLAPITSAHLLAALDWAEGRSTPPQLADRAYDQELWDCGTACCIHGAAHLLARGAYATHGPADEDYADLPPTIRDGVVSVLMSRGGTPALVRRVLSGELLIGANTHIAFGVEIGEDVCIGSATVIRQMVKIGRGSRVGSCVFVRTGVTLAPGTVVKDRAEVLS